MKRAVPVVLPLCLTSALSSSAADLPGKPFGEFAFVPHRRQFRTTPLYEFSHGDQFYDASGQSFALPGNSTLRQQTGALLIEYGLAPYVAADLTLSGVASEGPSTSGTGTVSTAGLGDTQFGVRWRLLDEDLKESEPFVPTLTFRLGGIAPGTYDANLPFAPGTGSTGLETRLIMSDTLGNSPLSLYGDVGWRWRANSRPSQFFGAAGVGLELPLKGALRNASANLGYAFSNNSGGGDLDPLTWSATDWRRLDVLTRNLQAGLALTDRGGRRYQFFASVILEGRNTAQETKYGFYVQIPFARIPRRHTLW